MDPRLIASLEEIDADPDTIAKLISELDSDSPSLPITTLNQLMTTVRDAGHPQSVLDIFEKIKSKGIAPREGSYSIVLKSCGLLKNLEKAEAYFQELRENPSLEVNVFTYHAVMDACVKCEAISKAREYFYQMLSDGVQPNMAIYTTLMNACAVEADCDPTAAETCDGLIREIKKRGMTMNAVCYTVAMKVHGVAGDTKIVLELFKEMQMKRIRRDLMVYNTLFQALGNGRPDVQTSMRYYHQMINEGIKPNQFTFSLLLRTCSAAGDAQQARQFLKEMRRLHIRPAVITYNTIIRAYVRSYEVNERTSMMQMCRKLMQQMEGEGIAPDGYTYSLLITLCRRQGDKQQGVLYFKEMKLKGIEPNAVAYTSMIDLYAELGDPSEGDAYLHPCLELLQEMEERKVKMDSRVFASLLVACRRAKDTDHVKELMMKMKQLGIVPTCHVYTSLMHFWSQVGDIEQALALFNKMQQRNVKPDVVTFTVLLEALVTRDEIPSVLELLKKMKSMGVQPNDVTRQVMRRLDVQTIGESKLREINALMETA